MTPIRPVTAEASRLFDQPSEIRVYFRSSSGDVHGRYVGLCQSLNTGLSRLARHDLEAIRACVYVTVPAGLIAELADVDLKNGDAGGIERVQAGRAHALFKPGTSLGACQNAKLFSSRGERVLSGK